MCRYRLEPATLTAAAAGIDVDGKPVLSPLHFFDNSGILASIDVVVRHPGEFDIVASVIDRSSHREH